MSERRHALDCRCYECQFTNLQSKCFDLNKENTELKAESARLRSIAEGLAKLDWCIGYSLTEPQHIELDRLRDLALAAVKKEEAK